MKYADSGVNIDKADQFTNIIKNTVLSDNIGLFAGIFNHPVLNDYSLVACTDGVGTKIIPLIERDLIENIPIDLVAMNLNDMICIGAYPLFFLDYFAVHTLDIELSTRFIKSLKDVLNKYNCVLLGGETAELNDLIIEGKFDVGGFAIGLVKKDKMLMKERVKIGDLVIGLKSSGPHSNGFTLIRRLYNNGFLSYDDMTETLEPTYIYVNEILKLCDKNIIKVCANVTGGGIADNLERVIPEGLCAEIHKGNIPDSPIFNKLLSLVGDEEAYKTFNMGVGMCLITSPSYLAEVIEVCKSYSPFLLGNIVNNKSNIKVKYV